MTTVRVMYKNLNDLRLEWIESYDKETEETLGEIYESEGFRSDFPSDINNLIDHIFKTRYYVRLDGWRGYMDIQPDDDKLTKLDIGFNWLSGHHSATKEEKKLKLFQNAVRQLESPVFLVSNQTGNFSSYTDVYVKTEDADALNKVSKFINDFLGDSDPRWDVGVLMHFDSDRRVGQSAIEDLNNQELPEWWNWKTFIEKHDILENAVDKMKTKSITDLDDEQQVGVMAGGMLSSNPFKAGLSKMLVEMKTKQIINKNNQGS